jgi:hypothetical protein
MMTGARRQLLASLLLALLPATTPGTIAGCLHGVKGCKCEWALDDTDKSTLAGLSHPPSYSAAEIAATGLPEAVVKGADASPDACERVCCESLVITDAPAAAQAPAQTGPCGVWQHGGGTGAEGCWIGLDNAKRQPPLPEVFRGGFWVGGARRLCRISRSSSAAVGDGAVSPGGGGAPVCSSKWGWTFVVVAVGAGFLYLFAGVALGFRRGNGMRAQAHPHYAQWLQLHGLVLDGVSRVRGVGSRGRAAGRSGARANAGGLPVAADDSSRPMHKSSKASKEKRMDADRRKRGGKRKAKHVGGDSLGEPLGSADATAAAQDAPTTASTTAAGGGGRWVHVTS